MRFHVVSALLAVDAMEREDTAKIRSDGTVVEAKSKVLSCQVILNNIGDFAAMNSVYDAWIDPANPPARAAIEARLAHPSLKVEIIAIAALD